LIALPAAPQSSSPLKREDPMNTVPVDTQRYDPVLRVSEAISICRDPEQYASVLAEELSKLLSFQSLDILVFKEGSDEIEWHAVGKGSWQLP
jgi:hypothetical protein